MKIFDFNKQLAEGDRGEAIFLANYPQFKKIESHNKGDFFNLKGETVELKYESRTTEETPNFFLELHRNEEKSFGGPWQAQEYGITYFVVLYKDLTVYWFRTEELAEFLQAHHSSYSHRTILNKGWKGEGVLVPRADLEFLMIKKERL